MAKSSTPSFVTTIPLIVSSRDEKEINARFNAGLRLYNACLCEAIKRVGLIKSTQAYKEAKALPRNSKARKDAFSKAISAYRFSDYEMQAFANQTAKASVWIADKLDANTQQKLGTRAFKAAERVLLGKAKKVRYKTTSRFCSLEGKTNKQGLRWKDELLVWGKLKVKPLIKSNDPVILHGLNSHIKYVRLIRKELNGKTRYFAQFICEGIPYQKEANSIGEGLVGIDLNISNVAVVGDQAAELMPFAEKVPTYSKEITKLQRQMQRSQRANNPNNYEPNFKAPKGRKTITKKGKVRKGSCNWRKSKRYLKAAAKKRELERRKTAYAKSQNCKLVNDILRLGKCIKTENVSVKAWQKRYGKAIAAKSPGFFQSELERKAANAGGQVIKFSTQKTALSQTHLNGERIKKSLSERVHKDVTGFEMHRDLFSTFLSRHVVEDELLLQNAQREYSGLEPILMEAWQRYQSASRVGKSESRKSQPPSEQISIKIKSANQIGKKPDKLAKV